MTVLDDQPERLDDLPAPERLDDLPAPKRLDDLPALMRPCELAEFLRKTENSLSTDRYLNRGAPYIRIGRSVLYEREAVREYLQRNTVTPLRD
jgi:hypothetical protein